MVRNFMIHTIVAVFLAATISGCATVPEQHRGAATGAGIGAATGAVAGAILGKDTEGALLGALAGALVGGAIGHYAYDQKRSRVQTQEAYNYKPTYGTVLAIEDVSSVPQTVYPGQTVELEMTYAVLNPSPDIPTSITETRTITHNGSVVGNPQIQVSRSDGTYTSTIPLHLPANAQKGVYVVKSEIKGANVSDSREFTFTVI